MGDAGILAVSAVIPSYNGQQYLGVVLAALAAQSFPADQYEVVLVDNNSTVDLLAPAAVRDALAAFDRQGVAFRCVREPRPGLTNARRCGVAAARAEIICFLDDDNEPDADYLSVGKAAFADPKVGLLVSRVSPVYETEPSPAVRRREHLLALNYRMGDKPVRWPARVTVCPTLGAGLWVRKTAFERVYESLGAAALPDRTGGSLVSGGDIEIGIAVGRMGYDRVYLPGLRLRHHIPRGRLADAYLTRLITGIVRSEATIERNYLGRRHARLSAATRFAGSLAFGWAVALRRGDFHREYRFMMAAALARLRGPFPPSGSP